MNQREAGLAVAEEMLGPDVAVQMRAALNSDGFGHARAGLALDFVFGQLWTRPGLDRRARSLVTLGILIAQNQTEELRIHLLAALRNGCTVQELEEVLYHCAGYTGFPAANRATAIAAEVFRSQGLID